MPSVTPTGVGKHSKVNTYTNKYTNLEYPRTNNLFFYFFIIKKFFWWGQMVSRLQLGRVRFEWRKPSTNILHRFCFIIRTREIARAPLLGQNSDFNANHYVALWQSTTLRGAKARFYWRIRTRQHPQVCQRREARYTIFLINF